MDQEKNEEKLNWDRKDKLKLDSLLRPMMNELLLVVEEEKKRTLQQIEDVKNLLEKIRNQ